MLINTITVPFTWGMKMTAWPQRMEVQLVNKGQRWHSDHGGSPFIKHPIRAKGSGQISPQKAAAKWLWGSKITVSRMEEWMRRLLYFNHYTSESVLYFCPFSFSLYRPGCLWHHHITEDGPEPLMVPPHLQVMGWQASTPWLTLNPSLNTQR